MLFRLLVQNNQPNKYAWLPSQIPIKLKREYEIKKKNQEYKLEKDIIHK